MSILVGFESSKTEKFKVIGPDGQRKNSSRGTRYSSRSPEELCRRTTHRLGKAFFFTNLGFATALDTRL